MANQLPKVYLRDLLWFLLVMCLTLGWWTERGRLVTQLKVQSQRRAAVETQMEKVLAVLDANRAVHDELTRALEVVYHYELPGEQTVLIQMHNVMKWADHLMAVQKKVNRQLQSNKPAR